MYVYVTHDEELAPADVARVEEVRLGGDALLVVVLEPARVRPRPDVGAVGVGEVLLVCFGGRFVVSAWVGLGAS